MCTGGLSATCEEGWITQEGLSILQVLRHLPLPLLPLLLIYHPPYPIIGERCDCSLREIGTESNAHQQRHAHRNLSGERRQAAAVRVEEEGPYRVHHEMLQSAPTSQLADGNVTEAPPPHILRQAAYERRVAERHSVDWAEDMMSTMETSRSKDTSSKVVKGGMQLICKAPLAVHLYREHFFRRFHQAPATLHLDATGSVTRQVGEKRPYLYALISDSPGTAAGRSYPLAHLLAERHTVPTVAHFLAQLSHSCKLTNKDSFAPPRVVTDHSWALLHAVSEAICKTTTEAYLSACWQALTDPSKQPKTIITLARSGGGGLMQPPPMSFSELDATPFGGSC